MRWWTLALIGIGTALGLVWIWAFSDGSGQDKVTSTGAVGFGAGLLSFLWLLVLSGLPLRARLLVVLGAGALLALAFLGLEIRGVTGDLVPIVGLRGGGSKLEATVAPASSRTSALGVAPPGRGEDGPPDAGRTAFPQFRGIRRDGHVEAVRLAKDFEERPPKLLWEREVGEGWSGFAVAGADAITQEQRGELECVVAYDRDTGEPRWIHSDEARYDDLVGGVGPRATPTIDGDRVFTLGSTGLLNALDRRTGASIWRRDVLRDHSAPGNPWGMSGSPLVEGDAVVVFAGGRAAVAAYDRESGALRATGGAEAAGYSSPQLVELAGTRQIVALQAASVAGYDAASLAPLWSVPWSDRQPNVAQPLVLPGGRVLVSSGYGVGSALFEVRREGDRFLVEEEWRSRSLKAKFANFVHRDGHAYGLDDGILVCIDVETGERRWKGGRYGHGQILLVSDVLLITAEQGDVVLVEATPDAHRERTRFQAFEEKQWNPPALAAPQLFVRTATRAACYALPLE